MHSTDCFQIMSLKDPVASGCNSELFICKVKLGGAALPAPALPDPVPQTTWMPPIAQPWRAFSALQPCSVGLPTSSGGQVLEDDLSALQIVIRAWGVLLLQGGL